MTDNTTGIGKPYLREDLFADCLWEGDFNTYGRSRAPGFGMSTIWLSESSDRRTMVLTFMEGRSQAKSSRLERTGISG